MFSNAEEISKARNIHNIISIYLESEGETWVVVAAGETIDDGFGDEGIEFLVHTSFEVGLPPIQV